MDRAALLFWTLLAAACDCDYEAHAPPDVAPALDAAPPLDGGLDAFVDPPDAGRGEEDAGSGDGPWVLAMNRVELYEPWCAFVEGRDVRVRVGTEGPNQCCEPGPVEVQRDDDAHTLFLVSRYWHPHPIVSRVCSDAFVWEDRWVDFGPLEQGTWTLRTMGDAEIQIEVIAAEPYVCLDPKGETGAVCVDDCDCASGHCAPDFAAGTCEGRCGELPCGAEPDCLEGRCKTEMPPLDCRPEEDPECSVDALCRPTDGPCSMDADCPPAQRCADGRCEFSEVATWTSCTQGSDCAAGWSCVFAEEESEEGVCAIRCFTDHTRCPIGACAPPPSLGPDWTCPMPAE